MAVAIGNREDAIQALINVWLKDQRKSCGWCGSLFDENSKVVTIGVDGEVLEGYKPCCEQPYITTNYGIFEQFHKELKERREEQKNKFASTPDKTLRLTVSMPPSLLLFLENSFERLYQEKLFNTQYNDVWFAKKFSNAFGVAKEI